jgi:hypothetical protein
MKKYTGKQRQPTEQRGQAARHPVKAAGRCLGLARQVLQCLGGVFADVKGQHGLCRCRAWVVPSLSYILRAV